ncbi:TetR family transcriptional regulator [Pseudonocardia sp. KRD-184]|uniref:TetR family transcriptional regulator n=1 Tax=Pseudonocardia oceani TaxID=2792013 RepID=A0ABS6UJ30_9PSEU|nr:TetR family transcriptional regulator [Pseudonocardia oceani]MBW0092801.1 TetR family transcriptional regulator [Pseudonocardia oceani]MBW0099613.1 TetR family transcriptional regulator [Pseudonocardia oceani]MBW0112250.1 TetR family transcriptional regulator [Pseudonocardia oceani]MBW0124657.1 TetR family transcriptional regulator [Pseudonocardia oceani]MBW0132262.1 TetR family transcriptional regulator [Pseudonocardia oceani]
MSSADPPRPADPRARAAQTKRDRTRRALLDAADATFGSRGWARTRIEDVAAAAGVSAATAYNHFPSKHTLIGHVFAPLVHPLFVQAERDVAADRPVVAALEDQIRALARTTSRHRELAASFFAAVQDYTIRVEGPADPTDEIDPRLLAPVPDAIRILVEHGQDTGALRPYPAAGDMATIVVNTMLTRAMNRPDETADARAELLLTILFGALCPEMLLDAATEGRPFRRRS